MKAIILAAGKGTRMRSDLPKVLHRVFGKSLIGYILETLKQVEIKNICVVVGHRAELVKENLKQEEVSFVLQHEQKGTGHAVISAKSFLKGSGDILILPGDMPLISAETIKKFIAEHKKSKAHASVLSGTRQDAFEYGRIVRENGHFFAIREELDATEAEREIREVNTGVYLFDIQTLLKSLTKLGQKNKKKEYYLTDTIEIIRSAGYCVEAFSFAQESEGQGVNSQKDLSRVAAEINIREIEKHQENGVFFISPSQTFVSPNVKIGQGTTVYPWTFIESNVLIGKNCSIGPFAKIRSKTDIADETTIGSFVEINRSKIGKKVAVKHLTYLGDAIVGDETNFGAGTITANYDGKNKHATKIGKNVFVGSNTVFVAPANIPDYVRTGAGSVVLPSLKIKKGDVLVGVPARSASKKKDKRL